MEVVPFEPAHLDILDPGTFDAKHVEPLKGAPLTGSSIFHDGRCLGVFFFTDLNGGVTRFHLFASDELRRKYGRFLARTCRDGIERAKEWGIEIMEGEVDIEFTEARRFAEWLGFVSVAEQGGMKIYRKVL